MQGYTIERGLDQKCTTSGKRCARSITVINKCNLVPSGLNNQPPALDFHAMPIL